MVFTPSHFPAEVRTRGEAVVGKRLVVKVVLYVSADCHLCERAIDELERLRVELGFEVDEIDISGVPELEQRYRRWIPVVEVEGVRVCVYRVDEVALRAALPSR